MALPARDADAQLPLLAFPGPTAPSPPAPPGATLVSGMFSLSLHTCTGVWVCVCLLWLFAATAAYRVFPSQGAFFTSVHLASADSSPPLPVVATGAARPTPKGARQTDHPDGWPAPLGWASAVAGLCGVAGGRAPGVGHESEQPSLTAPLLPICWASAEKPVSSPPPPCAFCEKAGCVRVHYHMVSSQTLGRTHFQVGRFVFRANVLK